MRRTWLAIVAVALLASGCARATSDPAPPESAGAPVGSGWERLPDPPLSGRVGSAVAAVDGRVLVAGGWEWLCPPNADCMFPDLPPLRDGAILDVGTGEWRTIATAPFGFHNARTVTLGDDVYLLTGCRATSGACDAPLELVRYEADADRWVELGRVPDPSPSYGTLVAVGDRVMVLGDSDENGERPDLLFDPATGRWQTLPDDPLPRVYDRWAVADGDRLLVFGSPMAGGQAKLGAAYDLVGGSWTRLPDALGPGYQVWRSGDEAWLNPHFGSDGGGVLDLRTDSWAEFPDPPAELSEGEATDLAGVIGWGGATYEYAAGPVRDTEHDRWLRIPERSSDTSDERVTALGDALVVFGGQRWESLDHDGELLAETWIWRP